MCTVSVLRWHGGYELFFNRDERRTRPPAQPPTVKVRNGVRLIAPIDGGGGGTWIGVNQYGLSLSLLNRYGDECAVGEINYRSRGLLLSELFDCHNASAVQAGVRSQELNRYCPFTLLAVETNGARILHWTGRELLLEDADTEILFLTSSSKWTHEVIAARHQMFRCLTEEAITSQHLFDLHRSHRPEPDSFSICMHRPEAATVSFSHLRVNKRHIVFSYSPRPPCQQVTMDEIIL